jgi:hypothetical protein
MDRGNYEIPNPPYLQQLDYTLASGEQGKRFALILEEVDPFRAELYERGKGVPRRRTHIAVGSFREALTKCSGHFKLSAAPVSEGIEWKKFLKLYCSLDCQRMLAYVYGLERRSEVHPRG